MSREIPFNPEVVCDLCGARGGYDMYGDKLCVSCAEGLAANDQEEVDLERYY